MKLIFVLLIGLLLANSVLFYKLWNLEVRLADPSDRDSDLTTGGGGRFGGFQRFDPSLLLKDPPKTQEDWMRVLQRQEVIHQVELEKWHQLLGTATSLLRQVR